MGNQAKKRKDKKNNRKIVKVQLSLATNQEFKGVMPELMKRRILIYSEDKQWRYEGDVTPQFVMLMGDRDKAYFYATKDGPMLNILDEIPCDQNQSW